MDRVGEPEGHPSPERLGRRLARRHELAARAPRWPGRLIRRRLRVLEEVHRELLRSFLGGGRGTIVAAPAEWLLDNQHLVLESLEQVREDLPAGFYGELPRLAGRGRRDEPRVFVLARVAVQEGTGSVDPERAQLLLKGYQAVAPLTTGEIWAFPAMLRTAVLEDLAASAARLVDHSFRERAELRPPQWEFRDIPPEERIPAGIESLRTIDAEDWLDFFEETSLVESALRGGDPEGVYGRMDFETRDRYRKSVEGMARRSGRSQEAVARSAVKAAAEAEGGGREGHVGYHLVGPGRAAFEARIGARPAVPVRIMRGLSRAALPLYVGSISVLALAVLAGIVLPAAGAGASLVGVGAAALLALVPALTVSVAVVNRIVTAILPPRTLPKMDYAGGIPPEAEAVVAVPALLARPGDARALAGELELNYLGNPDPALRYVLLTDFGDADEPTLPEDASLLEEAREAVGRLNRSHGSPGHEPFLLLHRPRRWNPREGRWMGWERKRGKLRELNRLILGEGPTEFTAEVGRPSSLRGAPYVVTLDADTFLPQGCAARLVGTLDHPLNRPEVDPGGRLRRGYTVLQPRIETFSPEGPPTWFARIYGSDTGLDLYSRAVSDVYQDLFGTGIFAGKGIYHVAAFSETLRGRIPENALLSHDLFEGVQGRAGLVSDVTVLEDFPEQPLAYMRRLHRWVRGDWQLLPWLGPRVPAEGGGTIPNPIPALGLWMIADNLRRSLLSPSLLLLLLAGWLVLPGPWWWWTLVAGLVVAVPLLLGNSVLFRARTGVSRRWAILRERGEVRGAAALRWLLGIVFLPHEALVEADAVARTLWRLGVSRRRLLQWTSQSLTARAVRGAGRGFLWRSMGPSILLSAGAALLVGLLRPDAVPWLAPLLLAWLGAPAVARWVGSAPEPPREALDPDDRRELRVLARRTWGWFERFLGPEDHWLPPDHFQVEPRGEAARRTSPTNIGLTLTSILGAYDLGYLGPTELVATLLDVFEGMGELERYRGHFLNWYSTRGPSPLGPRYVSTVDSGNLAACLVVLARGLRDVGEERLPRKVEAEGLADTLDVVVATLERLGELAGSRSDGTVERLQTQAEELRRSMGSDGPRHRGARTAEFLRDLEGPTASALETPESAEGRRGLAELRWWFGRARTQAEEEEAERRSLLSWSELLEEPPAPLTATEDRRRALAALREVLPRRPRLRELPRACRAAEDLVEGIVGRRESGMAGEGPGAETVRGWAGELITRLRAAGARATQILDALGRLEDTAERWIAEMEFALLYDESRSLFHIGFNVDTGEADRSYYDLLASEARIASLLAVGKGDVPLKHWLHLGRPFGKVEGSGVLLSWAGTAFEYLMPGLFLRTPPGSLVGATTRAAVDRHRSFGEELSIPWGISESAYHHLDAEGTYQYRAFGVPDLAIRRDPGDRVVVAPYASVLALPVRPGEVVRNLRRLEELGMRGRYGMYESVDFGRPRGRTLGRPRLVRSFMAHHQGMILMSLANHLVPGVMVRRFHSDSRIRAVEFLLHERAPARVRLEPRRREPVEAPDRPRPPPTVDPWSVDRDAPVPEVQVLSNGSLSALVTATGGGGLRWMGREVTRWVPDAAADRHGIRIFLRDPGSGTTWSATGPPRGDGAGRTETTFAPHEAAFAVTRNGISSRLGVSVAPTCDVEIRRLALVNEGDRARRIRVVSYGEPTLAEPVEDRRHPAFQKLFVEAEHLSREEALLFRRRPVEPEEGGIFVAHGIAGPPDSDRPPAWETDRGRFLGRHGSRGGPAALEGGARGEGTEGAPLDPCFSLSRTVVLPPGGRKEVVFLTAVAESRRKVLSDLGLFGTSRRAGWAAEQARTRTQGRLHALGLDRGDARSLQELLSLVVHPFHAGRRDAEGPVRDEGETYRRDVLWSQGISGDHPVLLVRASDEGETALPGLLIRAHALWREEGVEVDLALLDESGDGYARPLREWLAAAANRLGGEGRLGADAGIHYVDGGRLAPGQRAALMGGAAVTLAAGAGDLGAQLERLRLRPPRLPPFVPVPSGTPETEAGPPVERRTDLLFDNGLGGFTPDGREYVIHLERDAVTPAPWINVVATRELGFTVSEAGGGFTWAGNSGEHRLTPWTNDPVLDRPGEVLYLRDEETADVWTATPGPRGAAISHRVVHGAGYSRFLSQSHGLEQELLLFASPREAAKVVELRLRNLHGRGRRLTLTYYAEWVLGTHRSITAPHLRTAYDAAAGVLTARSAWAEPSGPGTAFLSADLPTHGWTCDRQEFLGEGGVEDPAALGRIGLGGAGGAGLDPCAALQVHVDLDAGEECSVRFFLGAARDGAAAAEAVRELRKEGAVEDRFDRMTAWWDGLLGASRVETPDPALDLMLNRWALYQAVSCRVLGRSALYQSSGAIGFRDQLQDVLALLGAAPEIARDQILEAARHQFPEGDVLHWWHPPGDAGVRTRCSDDLLWLPFAVSEYVSATGDGRILDEELSFLDGPALAPGEDERYERWAVGEESASLYEHCRRALNRGWTRGPHGLPLMGAGDWNDGMDRVGPEGRGESVWLGWFVHATAERFARVALLRGDDAEAEELRAAARDLRERIEAFAWDGEWYLRATYDDGSPLGSARRDEARIDSIAQSWAVLSGAAPGERAERAMRSAEDHLVREEDRLVRLLTPPFDRGGQWPGYIRAYPPGVRENGGQYNHAATWLALAHALRGRGGDAARVLGYVNPVTRAADPEAVARYRVEPYAVAGDISTAPPHVGRGGWTWYTGSAAWLYRVGTEGLLGLRPVADGVRIEPCLPAEWPGYEATLRWGPGELRIRVENPDGVERGVARVEVDGERWHEPVVPWPGEGEARRVRVRMGEGGPDLADAIHSRDDDQGEGR